MKPCCCSHTLTHDPTSMAKFIADQPHLSMLEKRCGSMSDLQKIYAHLIKTGVINHTNASSRVLAFCASSARNINYARMVFTQIQNPNLFIWNTIIRAFSRSSTSQSAISLFTDKLVSSSLEPERLTYPSVFKSYAQLCLAYYGAQLYGRVIKLGLECDRFVRSTILHLYVTCGFLSAACQLFDESLELDSITWNSMIIELSKCGVVGEPRRLFDKMPLRNFVSWNSMISGYVRNGNFVEALELLGIMQEEGIEPSEFTMVSLLNASGRLGAIWQGEWIHDYIIKSGIGLNVIVVTAIIDMYCKCGSVNKALNVFEMASKMGLSCWNPIIMGLATNGCKEEALELLSRLESLIDLEQDGVSFFAVLTACNHSGMVDKARDYFSLMRGIYNIEPSIRHCSCMVDALGRAGLLEEAEKLILSMPINPDAIIWGSLLAACRKHGNIEMAQQATERVIKLDISESTAYAYVECLRGLQSI